MEIKIKLVGKQGSSWRMRAMNLGYGTIEEYLHDLVKQDILHDFCENERQSIHNATKSGRKGKAR